MLRKHLLESTRGRLIALLRHGGMTADELAARLGVTATAVREQLAAMARDGVVQRSGQRPGTTRPAHVFTLTPDVEQSLSQAYVPFLTTLVRVVAERLPDAEVESLMRQTGASLATALAPRQRPARLRARVSLASRLINAHFGALTRVAANGTVVIRGVACPLAALTGTHPSVCRAVETFVATIVDAPVRECCDRHGRPRCCFEILPA